MARARRAGQRPRALLELCAAGAGIGADLELTAIGAALAAAADLPADVGLSINASPTTLADPRLHDVIREVRVLRLTIELTEHAVLGAP